MVFFSEKVSGYNEVEPLESKTFGYFDMASTMLYNKYVSKIGAISNLILIGIRSASILTVYLISLTAAYCLIC